MFKKKFIASLCVSFVMSCIPLTSVCSHGAYEDYTEEEIEQLTADMQKYKPEIVKKGDALGYSTDRFTFCNTSYKPVHNEDDEKWQEYLRLRTNIETVQTEREHFFSLSEGGLCLGISLTSLLAHNGYFSPSDIQEGKEHLVDITADLSFLGCKTDPVVSAIMAYHSRQFSPDFQLYMHYQLSHYDKEKQVDNLIETARKATDEGKWFLIAYDDKDLYHAVVGMGLIEGEFKLGGRTYDKCVLVYDSNNVKDDKETGGFLQGDVCAVNGCIYIDSANHDVFVPAYFMDDCGNDFKVLAVDDYDFLNYKRKFNPSLSYGVDVTSLNSVEVKKNCEYTLECTRADGTKYDGISSVGKVYKRPKNGIGKSVYLCDGEYFNVQNTGGEKEFIADFMDVRQIYTTTFNGCVNNIFKGEDEFGFDTLGETSYDVTIAFEEGCYDFAPHYRFDFSGTTDSDFKAFQTEKGVIVSGSDGVKCSLKTSDVNRDENGLMVSAEENIHEENIFASDSVLIAFDGDIPKFYIGENYENEVQKGDVNCDGFIDAVDASLVLQAYADLSTNRTTYLNKNIADWDNNGLIDARDSSFILQKYAELSTIES